jgi:hypothetical protein
MRNALNTTASVQIKGARPFPHQIGRLAGHSADSGAFLHQIVRLAMQRPQPLRETIIENRRPVRYNERER